MLCQTCCLPTRIIDQCSTRAGYRRRRECPQCLRRFTTTASHKKDPIEQPLTVVTRGDDGAAFENWLLADLPETVHLGELRRRYEA